MAATYPVFILLCLARVEQAQELPHMRGVAEIYGVRGEKLNKERAYSGEFSNVCIKNLNQHK